MAQEIAQSFLKEFDEEMEQLGVCLRLNDVPVPGCYGPTADEQ